MDFKTLRAAFRVEYPDNETATQTDLLLFELIKATKGETITISSIPSVVSSAINIVSPLSGVTVVAGTPLEILASSQFPRLVSKVEFYANDSKIGQDRNPPYSVFYTPTTVGSLTLRATAISEDGLTTVNSANVVINVSASPTPIVVNQPPTISLTNPGSVSAGQSVALSATANDPDGSISRVEFYQGTTKIGEDTSSPYSINWTPSEGSYVLTAIAFDNQNLSTSSSAINVTVSTSTVVNPTVSVQVPKAGLINEAQALSATASVSSGTISAVQFQVNGANQGAADTVSPFGISWTPTAKGTYAIRAIATASGGGSTTSAAVNIPIFDTKIVTEGAGTSLASNTGDYVLLDNNQAAGGLPASADLFVGSEQVGVLNYSSDAYSGKPFAFFRASNSTMYTGTIASGSVTLNG